jgi:hypothetical protein
MISNNKASLVLWIGAGMAVFAAPAGADMVLGYQELGPGGPVTGNGTVNAYSGTVSDFYGANFTAPTATITTSPSPGWGFYDDFIFSIPVGLLARTPRRRRAA